MVSELAQDVALTRRWWLTLRTQVPPDVAGLWFGIFTRLSNDREQRTMYVVGTATFDAQDESADWAAGGYAWEAAGRYIALPALAALPEQPFDRPLAHAAAVLREVAPWRDLPNVGVAVGYDDGDFEVLHGRR